MKFVIALRKMLERMIYFFFTLEVCSAHQLLNPFSITPCFPAAYIPSAFRPLPYPFQPLLYLQAAWIASARPLLIFV